MEIVGESGRMEKGLLQARVMVVEDDPTYLKLWDHILKELHVEKCWFLHEPDEALQVLKKEPVDLLISDVLLPKVNGYSLSQMARDGHPRLQIVLTTGYQTDLSRFDLINPRFHLLHKPYHNLNDIREFIRRLLAGEDVFAGTDEDSFSENEDYPEITEWTL